MRRKEFDHEKEKEIRELNEWYAKSLSTKDKKITKLSKDLEEKRSEAKYKDKQLAELGKALDEKRKDSKEKGHQINELS